jgi:PH (Pleckstrin Homology) domain-containing protein
VPTRVGNRWANAVLAAVLAVFGLVSASGAASATVPAVVKAGLLLVTAAFVVLAARALRSGASSDGTGLRIRGFLTTRRVPWADVAAVSPVSSGNATGSASCVGIALRSGTTIRARGAASYSRAKVQRFCDSLLSQAPPALRS